MATRVAERQKTSSGLAMVRTRLAQVVWLVAVVCALFLATGALLIALDANQDNALVSFVLDTADRIDLGVFSRDNGIFTFEGKDAATKSALANWGLGAVAYLIVGRIVERIVRP
ncbi:hypothetical protein [Nocardioides sp. YIM 152315]|uniref:hypothetical protein n=1 Tax=Nocardioides sp. YIM 152315 TaxID=3031760 RepID=UPI0023DBCC57|nr:hypothetical protein [Nocardioides sp. YIM 152315]MDF1606495.1 hypothetical protein [Nocardioides sp. YIM 152315]